MIFRQLDENGDWTFGAGLSNFAIQDNAIGLNIQTRLNSWVGDCFFDMPAGIDWINRLGSKNQRFLLEQEIKRVILQSYGVTSIINFQSELIERSFGILYNISTIYSPSFQNELNIGL